MKDHISWKIEEAQQHFSEIIEAVGQEPQLIYRQNQLVAVVIEAETFQKFLHWQQQQAQPPLSQVFAELRQLCQEEDYTLEIPNRSVFELEGLGKELWQGVDAQEYVNRERDSWNG